MEAIKIFKRYLRSDPKIFKRFKASTVQIKAMNIRKHVKISKEHDSKISAAFKQMVFDEDYLLVLKFCAYILRHHGLFIPIDILATEEAIQKDIQKAERFVI